MASFFIQQKITAFANQYRIYEPEGEQPGKLVGFAHQKRLALKEKILFSTDESQREAAFTLQARNIIELAGTYDVTDAQGQRLGSLRKQFKASLLRSTWHLHAGDSEEPLLVVRERDPVIAVLRRLWGFIPIAGELPCPLKYHFDFTDPSTGHIHATYNKITLIRDHYKLTADNQLLEQVDWRVLVAQGVALDALQSR